MTLYLGPTARRVVKSVYALVPLHVSSGQELPPYLHPQKHHGPDDLGDWRRDLTTANYRKIPFPVFRFLDAFLSGCVKN